VTLHNEDKHLLQFSSKGKLHDIEKLKKNLLTILQLRNETMAIFQDPESFMNITDSSIAGVVIFGQKCSF
jgi:hypothetical protein